MTDLHVALCSVTWVPLIFVFPTPAGGSAVASPPLRAVRLWPGQRVGAEVLPDHRILQTKGGVWTNGAAQQWKARVRQFLTCRRAGGKSAAKPLAQPGLANWLAIQAAGQTLRAAFSVGLAHFRSPRPLGPLLPSETRHLVQVASLPANIRASSVDRDDRSVIKAQDGSTRLGML